MRTKISFALLCMSAVAVMPFAGAANVWWVAKEDPNAADGNDGLSEATPRKTIQAAFDKSDFTAGDTINVKRGVYDEGATYTSASAVSNRVTITKTAHLVGVEGAALTHIVGAPSPGATDAHGRGDYATRCRYVAQGATSSTIKGFTLREGRTGAGASAKCAA